MLQAAVLEGRELVQAAGQIGADTGGGPEGAIRVSEPGDEGPEREGQDTSGSPDHEIATGEQGEPPGAMFGDGTRIERGDRRNGWQHHRRHHHRPGDEERRQLERHVVRHGPARLRPGDDRNPSDRGSDEENGYLRGEAPEGRCAGYAAHEKGAENPFLPVFEISIPKAEIRDDVARATFSMEFAG